MDLDDFPPRRHISRDLRISYRFAGETGMSLSIPAASHTCHRDGVVRADVLVTILDEATGYLAVFEALPDWVSTAALQIGLAPSPAEDDIVVDVSIVKTGKRLFFVEADVTSAGRRLGWASAEFARVPRADRNVDLEFSRPDPSMVSSMALEDSGLTRSYPESVGMQVLDAEKGIVELPFGTYIRNSSGILHGGVLGALSVEAAEVVARTEQPTARAAAADVQFLSPGRVGPFRTSAESMSARPNDHVWRIETRDLGDGERLMTRAWVTTSSA